MGARVKVSGSGPGCGPRAGAALKKVFPGISPVSLKQRFPLELGRHHEGLRLDATVGSRVLHFLRGRMAWMVPSPPPEAPVPLVGRAQAAQLTTCSFQVPLQLLPEVLSTEFHCGSPARAAAHRGWNPSSDPSHTASALTGTTSAEASTSALTKTSINSALPPYPRKPSFPTAFGFRSCQSLHEAPAVSNQYPPPEQQPGFCALVWTP